MGTSTVYSLFTTEFSLIDEIAANELYSFLSHLSEPTGEPLEDTS